MIIGAGDIGSTIIKELKNIYIYGKPVVIIDDDKAKSTRISMVFL